MRSRYAVEWADPAAEQARLAGRARGAVPPTDVDSSAGPLQIKDTRREDGVQ